MNLRTTEYTNPPKNDEIHHPDHYTWKGTECKKVIEMGTKQFAEIRMKQEIKHRRTWMSFFRQLPIAWEII